MYVYIYIRHMYICIYKCTYIYLSILDSVLILGMRKKCSGAFLNKSTIALTRTKFVEVVSVISYSFTHTYQI